MCFTFSELMVIASTRKGHATAVCVRVHACVRAYVHVFLHIMPNVNYFGRTVLYMCIEHCI